MRISIVVAASTNNVIGINGELPWRLPDDLKRFKKITMGKPIVMGRLTWESIGRALPGRQNIVMTRQPGLVADNCDIVASPGAALKAAEGADEVMVIGGGRIYELFLPIAHRVYLTRVLAEIAGDTLFPVLDEKSWRLVSSKSHAADEANELPFEFRTYERTAGS